MVVSSGALIIISLIIYLTWTLVGMFQLGQRNLEATASFGEGVDGFAERIQAVEIAGQKRSLRLLKYWKPVVWASGATALVAALLIGGAAILSVIPKSALQTDNVTMMAVRQAQMAAASAECSASVAGLYAQARSGNGATATNPSTGQHAVLIDRKWVIIPKC